MWNLQLPGTRSRANPLAAPCRKCKRCPVLNHVLSGAGARRWARRWARRLSLSPKPGGLRRRRLQVATRLASSPLTDGICATSSKLRGASEPRGCVSLPGSRLAQKKELVRGSGAGWAREEQLPLDDFVGDGDTDGVGAGGGEVEGVLERVLAVAAGGE